MTNKPIRWIGSSRNDLINFPDAVRKKAGFQLRAVQSGDTPSDFKPIPTVGLGVEEIRIRTEDAYRVFYVARFAEAVYVLYAFQKKTQKTSKLDIEIGQKRYQQMLQHQQSEKENMDK